MNATPSKIRVTVTPREVIVEGSDAQPLARDAKWLVGAVESLGVMLHEPLLMEVTATENGRRVTRYKAISGRTRIRSLQVSAPDDLIELPCLVNVSRELELVTAIVGNNAASDKWQNTLECVKELLDLYGGDRDAVSARLKSTTAISRPQLNRYFLLAVLPPHLYRYTVAGRISQTLANNIASPNLAADVLAELERLAAANEPITNKTLHDLRHTAAAPAIIEALQEEVDDEVVEDITTDDYDIASEIEKKYLGALKPTSRAAQLLRLAIRAIKEGE